MAGPHPGRAHPDTSTSRAGTATTRRQFPGGLHYADDKISAFLQGSTQYDGLGPRLVRRQALERLRRPHHRRRAGQGQRRSHRPARRGRARRAPRHGPLPRQGQPRGRRDLHPPGPARVREGAGHHHREARHPGHPDELPEVVLRSRRQVLRGLLRARPRLQPATRPLVPGHGDPQPRHRHHRERGHHRPEQRRRAGAAQRPDAQPRRHAHRDRRSGEAGGLLRRTTARTPSCTWPRHSRSRSAVARR